MELDWHAKRSDLAGAAQIEVISNHLVVDQTALALGRLERVREQVEREV